MKIRQLTAEGRRLYARLYAAVLDSGERRVVLSSEGDTAPTTDLLVWAGNNLPVLLDALDEAEEARARVAELEAQQQPRIIADPEELSALPGGALVHDGTAVFDHLGAGWWVTTGSADPIHSEAILKAEPDGTCGCTVIVLWTPEADIQSDIRILLLGKEFEARAAIDRVRKLHQPENGCDNPVHTVPDATCPQCCDYCQCCGEAMPCATIRAIDGEDSRFPTPKAGDFTGGVR